MLAALTRNLGALDTLDRLALPYELNTLASAGVVSIVDYLKVLEGYNNETEYCVWVDICLSLSQLIRIAEDLGCEKALYSYIIRVMEPASAQVGPKQAGEDASKSLLRSLLLGTLAKAGH